MTTKKTGLGRGLEAIIPRARADTQVQTIEVERIVPNTRQPRQHFTQDALRELADSIRTHGVIQPLVVTQIKSQDNDLSPNYQLIAGERRWQAAKLAGLATVPAIVREANSQERLELALIENIQRADLNPIEEAVAYRHLMDDFKLTQEQVAARVGKSRVAVANAVRLLKLPEEVRLALSEGRVSEGHARALLRLETAMEQRALLKLILDEGLSVRQVEERAEQGKHQALSARAKSARDTRQPRDPLARSLEEDFRRALGTKVKLARHRSGGGQLVIYFYSDEELNALHEQFTQKKR
jgi:ParB family chromosome partitioning protein